jgi:hypothetical protein
VDFGARGIEKDSADLAAYFRAARFDRLHHFKTLFAESVAEKAELRGFPAPVHTFECYKPAGMHRKFDFRTKLTAQFFLIDQYQEYYLRTPPRPATMPPCRHYSG